jgi:lysophospholipase L1-like esterase
MSAIRILLGLAAVLVSVVASAAGTAQYVALGSSFAAGPGITPSVPDSPPRCARSTENYAHVLARHRKLSLVDATCSGATTVDVIRGGQFGLPAQLDAVTAQTQLITVTIGGNDVFFMANLIAMSCDRNSAPRQPGGCTIRPDAEVEARFASLANSLHQIVTIARQRNPMVRVIFVNYFTVLPEQGTCALVALTAEQADHVRGVAARLAAITRKVAQESGADLLDAGSLSRTHNACSGDPWVLGAHPHGVSIPPFHPNREAMQAVGDALAKMF